MVNDNRDDSTDPHPRPDYFEPFPLPAPLDMPSPMDYAGQVVSLKAEEVNRLRHENIELKNRLAAVVSENERLALDLQQAQEGLSELRKLPNLDTVDELILGGPMGPNQETDE